MKKILIVFGTRPEAIKMCPLVNVLKKEKNFQTIVCVTGQHREMLDQVLSVFGVIPDYDLSIMKKNQNLFDITINVLEGIKKIIFNISPDIILVHGDTSTTFAASLAAFYTKTKLGHVEAGLRTYNLYSPYPEEFNRKVVSILANIHFAPTTNAQNNLLHEGIAKENIFVTGNTAIDALKTTIIEDFSDDNILWSSDSKLILLTAHRRENIGKPMENIFTAIKKVLDEFKNVKLLYPIHLNPIIKEMAKNIFGNSDRIRLIEPLQVIEFHNYMKKAYLILTDSGGIQEEAPSLGKPVLVLRDTTERPEGIEAGTLKLVGTNEENIYATIKLLLTDNNEYRKMSHAINPYGDGNASIRIANIVMRYLEEKNV